METALKRIKMNQTYISILKDLHCNRTSCIITAHGFTDPYIVQNGLDQGETHSPILWRIFYDPLLCAVKQIPNSSYSMQKVPDRDSPLVTTWPLWMTQSGLVIPEKELNESSAKQKAFSPEMILKSTLTRQ